MKSTLIVSIFLLLMLSVTAPADAVVSKDSKPNIIVYFADDISAREIPVYGSTVWSENLLGENSKNPKFRAETPIMDKLANEGVWVTNAWAATICNPSRAMMMTGRYAHRTKWWNNRDRGVYQNPAGKETIWPVYESSPLLISHIARKAGYRTYWGGKTQMAGSFEAHGFDEGCFTPGNWEHLDNPHTDFRLLYEQRDGKQVLINDDTGEVVNTYKQHGWNFFPHVKVMNHPASPGEVVWWPNTPQAREKYSINTYGADVEQEMAFDFMERSKQAGKPFFVYHTTHLGQIG